MGTIISGIISVVFGGVSSWFKGFFETKTEKLKIWQEGLVGLFLALRQTGLTDVAIAQLASQIWINDSNSEHFLTRSWRPIIALATFGLIVMVFFGYVPEVLNQQVMAPGVSKLFELVTLLIGGGMGLRTIDKIASGLSKTKIADKLMDGLANSAKNDLGIDLTSRRNRDDDDA